MEMESSLSPIVVENSEIADSTTKQGSQKDEDQEEEKEMQRPAEDTSKGLPTWNHPVPDTSEVRESILEPSGLEESPLGSLSPVTGSL